MTKEQEKAAMAEKCATWSDHEVAERITLAVALSLTTRLPRSEMIGLVTDMINDVRAGERVRFERAAKGAAIASSVLPS